MRAEKVNVPVAAFRAPFTETTSTLASPDVSKIVRDDLGTKSRSGHSKLVIDSQSNYGYDVSGMSTADCQ